MSKYKRLEALKEQLKSAPTPEPQKAPVPEVTDWAKELKKDKEELASISFDQDRLEELEEEIKLDESHLED